MAKLLSYSLSGQGITPNKSTFFFSLLKRAGVIFPPRPHFCNVKGKLYFHPVEPVEETTRQSILSLLAGQGVKNAVLESCGSYVKK
jgi:hypothetical protein